MSEPIRLPSYSDDEVRVFHPFFASALEVALFELELQDTLEVVHHWRSPYLRGIIDFAIVNRQSKKVLLPIEIKKTAIDLKAIGRKQARGYLENLGPSKGSDYYMASNLETNELFKFSVDRPLTVAQLLKIDGLEVGNFEASTPTEFFRRLILALKTVLGAVRANDGTVYASNVSGLINALETRINDADSWRQANAVYSYEYVRGALSKSSRHRDEAASWPKLVDLADSLEKMSLFAGRIDFELIFNGPLGGGFNKEEVAQIAAGAFEAGEKLDSGSELSSIINEIATGEKKIPGVVETPPPLARLLANYSIAALGRELNHDEQIFEPCCGGGNLIVEFKKIYGSSLDANQVFGIEREALFRELLGLRVGLAFMDSIAPSCRPRLEIRDLTTVDLSECRRVALTLMNPPFIRGIDAVDTKERIGTRIANLTNCTPELTTGQLGLECAYLELVCALLPTGSILGLIFPKNALMRSESEIVRKFLIDKFGLSQIVLYPETNVFGEVQKSTVILVGVVGTRQAKIVRTAHTEDITDLDFETRIDESNPQSSCREMAGSVSRSFDTELFENGIKGGWKELLSGWSEAYEAFASKIHEKTCTLESSTKVLQIARGAIGNCGMSRFLFNPGCSQENSRANPPTKWSMVPRSSILPALKNSDSAPILLTKDLGDSALSIPEAAITDALLDAVTSHLQTEAQNVIAGVQAKRAKSREDVRRILTASKAMHGHFVLVPRAERRNARIIVSKATEVLVSTNFHTVKLSSYREAVIIGSWFISVFGQIELEFEGIDQEGMRKLEVGELRRCQIPMNLEFSDEEFVLLEAAFLKCAPRDFFGFEIEAVDQIWARRLFDEASDERITESVQLLSIMCLDRLNRVVSDTP